MIWFIWEGIIDNMTIKLWKGGTIVRQWGYTMNRSAKNARIGASVIDLIIVYGIMSILVFARLVIRNFVYYGDRETTYRSIGIILTVAIPVICFTYYTLIPYFTKGATLGKLIVGIRVRSLNYDFASFRQLFFRNVFFFHQLSCAPIQIFRMMDRHSYSYQSNLILNFIFHAIFIFLYIIIMIMILVTDEERGLHDMLSGTIVTFKGVTLERINQATLLERKDMSWAEFEDQPLLSKPNEPYSVPTVDDDEILILMDDDESNPS